VRRCLHACLIGALTLSLSMDTARACWYLRQACHPRPVCVVACEPCAPVPLPLPCVETTPWVAVETEACSECSVADGEVVTEWTVGDVEASPVDAMVVVDTVESTVLREEPVAAPVPTLAEPVELPAATAELTMLQPASEAVQQTTALAPNDSATAEEPEVPAAEAPAEPEPMIEAEPAAAIEPPAVEEPNMFEEVERAGGPTAPIDAITPFSADAPLSDAPPMPEPPAADNAPEPASEEPAADEPATEDPFDAANANEPVRRWIDRTGGYAVVGTLVAVGEDGTCELAAAGRRLRVSIEALSDHDRDYARRATTRLTAGRTGKPATGDTAGL
jgi:hypothetical protein